MPTILRFVGNDSSKNNLIRIDKKIQTNTLIIMSYNANANTIRHIISAYRWIEFMI